MNCLNHHLRIRRFSMVEILSVIAVIAILATIGATVFPIVQNRMAESSTQTTIMRFDHAIRTLYDKHKIYPPPMEDDIFIWDIEKWEVKPKKGNKRNFVDMIPVDYVDTYKQLIDYGRCEELYKGDTVKDAWDNDILYIQPGKKNINSFDLVSKGADESYSDPDDSDYNEDENDDIANYTIN